MNQLGHQNLKNVDVLAELTADAFKLGHCFGVVGIPMENYCRRLQHHGMNFISGRNEQSMSYAAAYQGFVSMRSNGRPGLCVVSGGPAILHSLPGCYQAHRCHWPMVLICSSNRPTGKVPPIGEPFHYLSQREILEGRPDLCHECFTIDLSNSTQEINEKLRLAVEISLNGNDMNPAPGFVYVEISRDLLESDTLDQVSSELAASNEANIVAAIYNTDPKRDLRNELRKIVKTHKRPLVLFGETVLHGDSVQKIRNVFSGGLKVPVLTVPMAKGILNEFEAEQCMFAARRHLIETADAIFLIGTPSPEHWFVKIAVKKGRPTYFMGFHNPPELGFPPVCRTYESLPGDCRNGDDVCALISILHPAEDEWYDGALNRHKTRLSEGAKPCRGSLKDIRKEKTGFIDFFNTVERSLIVSNAEEQTWLVVEGASTLDFSRHVRMQDPCRLDPASNASMGMGVPAAMAIACDLAKRGGRVMLVIGDSAVGFSGFEMDTIYRYNLPITVVVTNNGGVYSGGGHSEGAVGDGQPAEVGGLPCYDVCHLNPHLDYGKLMTSFGSNRQTTDENHSHSGEVTTEKLTDALRARKPFAFQVVIDGAEFTGGGSWRKAEGCSDDSGGLVALCMDERL